MKKMILLLLISVPGVIGIDPATAQQRTLTETATMGGWVAGTHQWARDNCGHKDPMPPTIGRLILATGDHPAFARARRETYEMNDAYAAGGKVGEVCKRVLGEIKGMAGG